MISIIAKFKVTDRATFLALAKEFVQESNKEEGCIEYGLHQDLEDENSFIMNEKWADQAAIDAHNTSAHFTRLSPLMGKVAEVSVSLYKPAF